MSYMPAGSLVFSAYGSAPFKFYSPGGVDLGAPAAGAPNVGPLVEGIVALKTSGRIPVITGTPSAFGATLGSGVGLYNTDFTFFGVLPESSGGTTIPAFSIARDDSDNFYSIGNFSAIGRIYRYNSTGQLNEWTAVNKHGGTNLKTLGVNGAGTIAYYAATGSGSNATVYAWSLAGAGSDLGTFASFGSSFVVLGANAILSLSNGDVLVGWSKASTSGFVIRYNAAGVVQQTYTLVGTNASPIVLTYGLTDNTFWVGYYVTGLATSSGCRIAEIDISTGTVLNTFDPNDGSFAFDSPFCVLRAAVDATSTPPPDNPPPIPLVACAPAATILTSPTRTAGCNPGGIGWEATYTGGSGTVPIGADPVDGETLTGKPGVHVWVEATHTVYPAETVQTNRWAMTDLDDVARKEGRLLSIGDVEHGLSDGQGNMTAGTIDVQISDLDGRPIGSDLVDTTKKFFQRDEMAVFAISTTGRRTGAIPRIVGRGLLQHLKYGTPAVVDFNAVDPFFCDGGAFGPDKKVPSWTIPPYYINAPVDVYAKFLPIIIGEVSDEGAIDPVTNLPSSRGVCPLTFVGMDGLATGPGGSAELWGRFNVSLFASYAIIGLYGSSLGGGPYGTASATSDGAAQSVISLPGGTDLSSVVLNTTTITLYTAKGRLVSTITAVSGTNATINNQIAAADATNVDWIVGELPPQRVKIDLATRNGQDCMVFGYPNYVRSTTYEDIMGSDGETYRVTDVWIRGPLLDDHLAGIVTLAANVIGVEDRGDGTGLPLTDYFTAYNWFIENCVLVNSKQPKGPGLLFPQTDGDLATYADGTYMVRGSSFVAAQAASAIGFGGDGLKTSAYFGAGISTRDAIQLWNDNGGCRTGINEHGQVFVWFLDRTEDTTTWPRIEHVNRVFGQVERDNPDTEIENVTQGACDWEPDAERYRSPLQQWPSATGIRHNKGLRKYSKSIDGKLTGDPLQWSYILQQRLAYAQDGPVYVTFTGDIGLLDYPIGSGIQFTSPMGPGASSGYVDQPLIILTKRFHVDSHMVTLTCLDVGAGSGTDLMVDPDLAFILDDETGSPGARLLGDEQAVPSTAMVLM